MFKWLSRSGMFLQVTIFLVFALLLWLPAFVHPLPPVVTSADGPMYPWLINLFGHDPQVSVIMAALLVVFNSFFIFYIFHVHQFFGRSNFLPAIIALLCFSWNPIYLTMHAVLPAMLFILIALHLLLTMYGKNPALKNVFSASLAVGMASLLFTPLCCIVLLVWFTLISYRISAWREYIVSIIGFVVPYLYYASGLFWSDNLAYGWEHWLSSVAPLVKPAALPASHIGWLMLSSAMLVVTLFTALNAMGDRLISVRRRSWVLFNLLIASLPVLFLTRWHFAVTNYLFIPTMAFAVCSCLFVLKKPFRFEIVALLYFLAFVLFRLLIMLSHVL